MNFNSSIYIITLIFILKNFFASAACALVRKNSSEFEKCDYKHQLKPSSRYTIFLPEYPAKLRSRGINCRWVVEAPEGYRLVLDCNIVKMPLSFDCLGHDRIHVSTTGRSDLSDAKSFCGNRPFKIESRSTRLIIFLKSSPTPFSAKFLCSVRTIAKKCTCGARNQGKIAGGNTVNPNEYPSMAGLVDFLERRIYCGAIIISSIHALSAAHCKLGRAISTLGLIVGEHDTELGNDSNFTFLARISKFIIHSGFNQITNEHDIALIKVREPLTFNKGVQAACLPFGFTSTSLVSRNVQAVGWGSSEFAGPQSNVLQHVTLKIVDYGNCTSNQICSYGINKDTCQSDSGGPLYLYDNSKLFVVGIVSYGFECATREPAVNTKVTAYLNWILKNTPSTDYCAL